MNFLAHIVLSGNREEVILGNFTGDFIKGKLTPARVVGWSEDYILGVRLHRFIDHFTDSHSDIRTAKNFLAIAHPKVAGVAMDIYLDYFLANRFTELYGVPLADFVQSSYQIIQKHRHLIPAAMVPMAESMIRHDWLYHYKDIAGIKRSFDGLANRFASMRGIRGAEVELLENYPIYEAAFLSFYPALKEASAVFLQKNNHFYD
jgi:acyl carrier protein phosphodiesterase